MVITGLLHHLMSVRFNHNREEILAVSTDVKLLLKVEGNIGHDCLQKMFFSNRERSWNVGVLPSFGDISEFALQFCNTCGNLLRRI